MTNAAGRALVLAAIVAALCSTLEGAERYDPRLRFRTLATAHFDILYHQGEEALARRLAKVAESVASRLHQQLGRPSHRVRIVLVDQTDLSNGWATPLPFNLIEITAAAPPGASVIGHTDDWLRLVFTHEYTHVLHLDRGRGWLKGFRYVLGRSPILFPNVFLPLWQIEGIATYEESAQSGRGRLRAGEVQSIVSTAAGSRRFATLDRASSSTPVWPGGSTPYLFGGFFHEYLVSRYGEDSLRQLADETSGRLPYFGSPAFRKVFGRSLGELWRDFEGARATEPGEPTRRRRLTEHGFTVTAPHFTPGGRLFYSVVNPHGFPALLEHVDGGRPREVTTRYLGERLSGTRSHLVFDQIEFVRSVGLQSDLYEVALDGSGLRRLTRGARAAAPDVTSDGRTIVCTVQLPDRRAIATMELPDAGRLGTPAVLVSEPFTDFSSPRWSPDGRWIAAERRRVGDPYEIVVIDRATRDIRTVYANASGRAVAPSWLDDRTLLLSRERQGVAFGLVSVDVNTLRVRVLTQAGPGAHAATRSPDGRTLVYVGYSADGYDLYSLALDSAAWTDDAPVDAAPSAAASAPLELSEIEAVEHPYRPWSTLVPRFWTPVVASDEGEWLAGAATAGLDALGRHAYFTSVAWSGARARPDWTASYAYDRWRPTLYVGASDDTDPFRDGTLRTTEFDAGSLLRFRRVRWSSTILAAFHASTDRLTCTDCGTGEQVSDRRAIRTGWAFSSAREYGFSISSEEGLRASIATEVAREAIGSDGDAASIVGDVRWYVRVRPRHAAVALRVAAATAGGDEDARRIFSAGGSGPQPSGFAFGFDAIGLLRGFDESDLFGRHAAVANLDLRVPIVRVERGAGTLPFFLRALHGSLFLDVGHAWDGGFRFADVRSSFGAEVSADAVLGYVLPLTFTAGAARRDDPTGEVRGWSAFARIGRAF